MFGAILKATNCSFQKGITLCRSIYVTKVMKLLAFIFEQPSYWTLTKLLTKSLISDFSINSATMEVEVMRSNVFNPSCAKEHTRCS